MLVRRVAAAAARAVAARSVSTAALRSARVRSALAVGSAQRATATSATRTLAVYARLKELVVELYRGSRQLYQNTKKANEYGRMRKNGLPLNRRQVVFLRTNRYDLLRCIPVLLVWKGIPIIGKLFVPIYIYFLRYALPSPFQFFNDTDTELRDKEIAYKRTLLDSVPPPVWLHKYDNDKSLALDSSDPWPVDEVRARVAELDDEFNMWRLSRRQWAAVNFATGLHPTQFMPSFLMSRRFFRHLEFVRSDDAMLRAEGLGDLTFDELRFACQCRGLDYYDRSTQQLRQQVALWLDTTHGLEDHMGTLISYGHGFRARTMSLMMSRGGASAVAAEPTPPSDGAKAPSDGAKAPSDGAKAPAS